VLQTIKGTSSSHIHSASVPSSSIIPLSSSFESHLTRDLEYRSTTELLDELYQRGFFNEDLSIRDELDALELDLEQRAPFGAALAKLFTKLFQ